MTIRELSQLYYLRREIAKCEEELAELRARAMSPATAGLSNVGRKSGVVKKIEKDVEKIHQLEELVRERLHRSNVERIKLELYIAAIEDAHTRLIFEARFVRGLRWEQVADVQGGNNTADGVRMVCVPHINLHP